MAAGAAGLKAVQDRFDRVRDDGASGGAVGPEVGGLLAGRAIGILLRGDDVLVAGCQAEFDGDDVIDAIGAVGWFQRKWAAPSVTPLTTIVTGVEVVASTPMYAPWNPLSVRVNAWTETMSADAGAAPVMSAAAAAAATAVVLSPLRDSALTFMNGARAVSPGRTVGFSVFTGRRYVKYICFKRD
ncbi:hypothetical protein [Nocardia sp. NPDC004860]|uniref:hypothetical protein n=1 Tax=Nocardia sp. NPDC004860 TaxID=3154557 RepID=UPI0033ADCB98